MSEISFKDLEYRVLDKGWVKYIDHMGDDNSSLEAARMSTSNPTGVDKAKDDKLRNFLWKNNHSSPTEMAELVIEMQCPLFVLREIDRHRTLDYATDQITETVDDSTRKYMSRNEFSGRYSEMLAAYYYPGLDQIKAQHKTNKQASGDDLPYEVKDQFDKELRAHTERGRKFYEWALSQGIARETARMCLPLNQYTKLRLKGSLLSWFKFLNLRDKDDVQWETREYAKKISRIVENVFPASYEVFVQNTLHGVHLSLQERETLTECLFFLKNIKPNHSLGKDFENLLNKTKTREETST